MKRLVVCCDGTWQSLDNVYPTNVLKMAQAIRMVDHVGIPQVVYYDGGVGTGAGANKITGGAFGVGIDNKIQDAYRFLSLNYAPGDEIYLFGFSRGAYTVRSLAGLIYNSGLLRREFVRKTAEAYELYRNRARHASPSGSTAIEFRKSYAERIDITVLGCWDTVGALGVPDMFPLVSDLINQRYRFYDTTLNQRIQKAFHAVAIDEIREIFDVTPMHPSPQRDATQVLQTWFPGDHGCVGGGAKQTRGLSDMALEWMMDQTEPLGLAIDRTRVEDGVQPDPGASFDNRPKGIFRLTRRATRRVEARFEDLHYAVKRRWRDLGDYHPANLKPFERDLEAWNPY